MSRMNWDRVNAENLGARRGYEQMESIPPTPPTPPKKKSKPMKSTPPKKPNQNHSSAKSKNECKVVQVEQISGYLECDHGKLVTSLQHLAEANGAVEVTPGEWVLIQRMLAPPYTRRGKLITMQPRHRKVEPICPLCNSQMVRRVSIHGPFLSCTRFPACQGKRSL